ncbi:MAG TPA: ABC transporter permease [Gryllotalpicola sp.]
MTTTAPHAQHTAPVALGDVRLSFPRLIRSEWIKLRTIRSTVWCFLILFVVNIGLTILAASVGSFGDGHLSGAAGEQAGVSVITLGVNLTSLVVAVLGVLIVSGEYATGMIRSTFTADPGRLGALFAKAVVLAVSTFVVSAASTWIAALIAVPILSGKGVDFSLASDKVFMPILGSSVYVTLLALLAFGIGLLVRTTAGGIAIALGLLLVLPPILQILGGLVNADWASNINAFLPSEAGRHLYQYDTGSTATVQSGGDGGPGGSAGASDSGIVVLNGWEGFGVTAGLVFLLGCVSLFLVKRRDA